MKFADMPYRRPDVDAVAAKYEELLQTFRNATSADEQAQIIETLNEVRTEFQSMGTLVHIHNSINTQDEFYKAEQQFFDDNAPTMEGLNADYYRALAESKFRNDLEAKFGSLLFTRAELAVNSFSPEIKDDLRKDNQYTTKYNDLIASAQIPFDGKVLSISQFGAYLNSTDRDVRKAANEARWGFFAEHEQELDEIYDELVRARTSMGKKMGHENFIPLAYARLRRTDYDANDVEKFRKQIETHIVPLAEKLKVRQHKRIGVDNFLYYDEGFNFTSGNPTPKGDPDWIVENGRTMYRELSAETDEFFSFMTENSLMDLLSRKGKRVGGYCTNIPKYKSPFIFANMNGTAHDVTVLTHEAGHAFMGFCARDIEVPEYRHTTLEAAEIHSMSMEFFTWPWMELFFKEDTEKFKFSHLAGAITTIPYLVTVDEFQHFVYGNPEASPADRKQAWRNTEKKYIPHRNYGDNDYLEHGNYWHQQLHIFGRPFYYIDYALAQVCALQFWKKMMDDREAAWKDYLHLCKLAGTMSFVDLVREANLISPFEEGCVASVVSDIEAWLDSVDDTAL